MNYRVVFERALDGGVGAYAPDLPGTGVVGDTQAEAAQLLTRAVQLQVEAMIRDGIPLPEPSDAVAPCTITPTLAFVHDHNEALLQHVSWESPNSGSFKLTRSGGFTVSTKELVGADA